MSTRFTTLQASLDEVLFLYSESRLLCAVKTFNELKASLLTNDNSDVAEQLLRHSGTINQMFNREEDTREVLAIDSVDDSWIFGSVMFGARTHYKLLDGGSLLIRLEGELDNLLMFEQLAIIHEVDLFHDWVPFCNKSMTVTKVGPVELVA